MAGEAQRVVFDCVVCAQAIINPDGPAGKCLELARDGALNLCISEYLLTEIRELPDKLAPRLRITPQKVEQFILDLLTFSRQVATVPDAECPSRHGRRCFSNSLSAKSISSIRERRGSPAVFR